MKLFTLAIVCNLRARDSNTTLIRSEHMHGQDSSLQLAYHSGMSSPARSIFLNFVPDSFN